MIFRLSVLFRMCNRVHKAMIDLLLSLFAKHISFFQLICKNFGDLRGVMVKYSLAGDQQHHTIRPDALMKLSRCRTQHALRTVPFHGPADCFGSNDADRCVLCVFVPEAD